jgi:hypothetical protein
LSRTGASTSISSPWSQRKSRSTGSTGLVVSGIRGLWGFFFAKETMVKSESGRVIVNLLPTQQDAHDLDRSA